MIPLFLLHLVLRLAVQTASATADLGCIAALSEVVFQYFGYASTAFLDQFLAEYRDVAASAARAMRGRIDGSGLFRPAGKLITRWKDQFLSSEAGFIIKYTGIANEPPEGPSVEVKRKVITDLRECADFVFFPLADFKSTIHVISFHGACSLHLV
ncbi:hypothetical protein C8J57DRAFT_1525746 [Mycena rebaudengoi]|nr:hypothetical protein C8J57DRAFT_1525746 [Mycena rebaudengoi]